MAKAVKFWLTKLDPPGEGREIMAVDAPTPEQRDGLERRLALIAGWMRSAPVDRVESWVAAVIGTMGFDGTTEADAELSIGVYVTALDGLAGFAVEAACKAFLQARVHGQRRGKRPTPDEICFEAQRQMYALSKERREIDAVLSAKVVPTRVFDAERRKQVLAEVDAIVKKMRQDAAKKDAEEDGAVVAEPEPADAALDRLMSERDKPIAPLSPSARASFRIPTVDDFNERTGS